MKRTAILLFGLLTYGVFFATFLYLVAFTGNLQATGLADLIPVLPALVPHSVDIGGAPTALLPAVLINLGLVAVFGLQHSVMARLGFKTWLKRHLPASAERSVYVLLASMVLMLLFWQWRPLPELLWSASSTAAQAFGWIVFAGGFGLVLLSTFLIDHFDLFGLRQVWQQFTGRLPTPHKFVTPLIYRLVRHPLYLGFLLALWGGPTMSIGHALFAGALTVYILIAIQLEERDLVRELGERYVSYRKQVPMLVPGLARPFDEARDTAPTAAADPSR
ncbi:methanethiol S-methyltransferase [Arenimonas terrae]|uniref:methanethiol S-methyltransferase n=1 Tax=Arenimonas terrae TaxID=2546226 RepID=A0A5C4RXJ9_9GAMM|nr:methanethiol S-methyltransferase [Arenimonas terrae]TNJ35702.1 isoprenylcysteine carboxylmethyltransferase family protein [Arenimonas terrae]